MEYFKNAKKIVVKIGSSSLTYDTGLINMRRIESLCKLLSDIHNSGKQVILVSSGAIAVGTAKLGLRVYPKTTAERQAAAAVGQSELMYLYDKFFSEYNHKIAQVLLTREDIENPKRKHNVENTFSQLQQWGAIPIVNENDTVSVEEIEIGDNDTLSAIVASLTQADGLILMSDIDGLYDANPNTDPTAKLIPVVEKIDESIERMAGGAGTKVGTGGMATKIAAAKIATKAGCAMCIMNSNDLTKIYDLLDGKQVGTLFLPSKEA